MNKYRFHMDKLIHFYFDYLVDEYKMSYRDHTFSEYMGFRGPIETYSFFNRNGCFTIHFVVQKDELGFYKSGNYSENQYDLLEQEIYTSLLDLPSVYTKKRLFLYLSNYVREEIEKNKAFFGIALDLD